MSLKLLRVGAFLVTFFALIHTRVNAQENGEYRSLAYGNWGTLAIWQRYTLGTNTCTTSTTPDLTATVARKYNAQFITAITSVTGGTSSILVTMTDLDLAIFPAHLPGSGIRFSMCHGDL